MSPKWEGAARRDDSARGINRSLVGPRGLAPRVVRAESESEIRNPHLWDRLILYQRGRQARDSRALSLIRGWTEPFLGLFRAH